MSGFLGGAQKTQITTYSGLQVQTTSSCLPVPICYGENLLTPNVVWYNNFQQHVSSGKAGGKGGSGSGAHSYTYSAAIIMALCEGQINGIGNVWTGTPTAVTLSAVGLSLVTGAASQAVWSYLASAYPAQALTYNGTAYLYSSSFNLGPSASVGSNSFEVRGLLYQSGCNGVDADPAQCIQDFLTNARYGVGFPSGSICTSGSPNGFGALLGATGDASYQTYCWATGLAISPFMNMQEKASSILSRWLQITNSTAVWTGGQLKFIPFGDYSVSGNGRTWNPDVTPIYDLTDDDYVSDGSNDPLKITRSDPYSAYNQQSIEIQGRLDNYTTGPIVAWDQSAIDRFGLRVGSSITAHEITDLTVARTAVQLILQRGLYVRNTYTFKLSWEFCLLDPMDLVTLTDAALGMTKVVVRITDIEEDDSGLLTVTAEEFPQGVATAAQYPTQIKSNGAPNTLEAPGSVNTPIIFEPPGQLAGALQVWCAVSGANPSAWGGCNVWASLDGSSYAQVGTINSPARMGVLSASLSASFTPYTTGGVPAGLTVDNTNTLAVNLTESAGQLLSGSLTDAWNAATLCYVDGEYIAYMTATLTGTDLYNVTYLVRGLYGSAASIVPHASGANFAVLDANIFKWTYNNFQIGASLSLKFSSFNIWGASEETLASVPVYTYTLTGSPTPGTLTIITSTLTQPAGSVTLTLNASWSSDPLAVSYIAETSSDSGNTWTIVYNAAGTQLAVSGLGPQNILFRVAGVNANDVRGPWAQDGVVAPVINYGPSQQITLVTYDQLSEVINDIGIATIQAQQDAEVAAASAQVAAAVTAAQTAAAAAAAQTGVTIVQQAASATNAAFASYQVTVNAQLGSLQAQFSNVVTTSVLANYATVSALETVQAQTNAGTANGQIAMVAQSGVSGVDAAIQMQVSTSVGGALQSAGLTVEVDTSGVSWVIINSANFAIMCNSTKTVPFLANANGTITLQGVTKFDSILESGSVTSGGSTPGVPVLQIDGVNGVLSIYDNT